MQNHVISERVTFGVLFNFAREETVNVLVDFFLSSFEKRKHKKDLQIVWGKV